MVPLIYLFSLSLALVGIALAGLGSDRHFVVIVLGIELILVASMIALVAFFDFSAGQNPGAVAMLVALWAVAAVEIVTLVTFYVYMRFRGVGFDVAKLSRMRW